MPASLVAGRERQTPPREELARAGNARVRRGTIQLAWRFLLFQKDSELARWFQARTTGGRKTMIVALARKLLIALWRFVMRARCRRTSSCVCRDGGTRGDGRQSAERGDEETNQEQA